MKKNILIWGIIILVMTACQSGFLSSSQEIDPQTSPLVKPSTSTDTPTPMPLNYPEAFPLPMLTNEQIQEVAECDIENLAQTHYPENIKSNRLIQRFSPVSNCDWAVLAYSYAMRIEDDTLSQQGIEAYQKAISQNYGFAFPTVIFNNYFGSIPLVQKPQFANQEITKVEIHYSWGGFGNPAYVEHNLVIDQANGNPILISDTDTFEKNVVIDKKEIQGLAEGLIDLMPIGSKIQDLPCTDSFPSWLVTLTFVDGTQVVLETDSNFLFLGGPWLTQIDGLIYLQNSPVFSNKMGEIMSLLNLSIGEPEGMFCHGGVVFENAFDQYLSPTLTPTTDFTRDAIITEIMGTVKAELTQAAVTTPTLTPK